jgi:hypothetical protein
MMRECPGRSRCVGAFGSGDIDLAIPGESTGTSQLARVAVAEPYCWAVCVVQKVLMYRTRNCMTQGLARRLLRATALLPTAAACLLWLVSRAGAIRNLAEVT